MTSRATSSKPRALSRGLRAYLPGERLTLDEGEADALEISGFVMIVGRAMPTPPKRKAPKRS